MDNYIRNYNASCKQTTTSAYSVLMRNVYTWMAAGIGLTALIAYLVSSNATLVTAITSNPLLLLGVCIAEIGMVWYLSRRIMNLSFTTAILMFFAYAALNGVSLSLLCLVYSGATIAQALFITAGTFAGMSLLGYTTRTDLSTFGRIMYMSLIGLILASLVNLFWVNSAFTMILNYLGVFIFVGLTAYDTQKIKDMLEESSCDGVNEHSSKIALMGSLRLYLDFVNLFIYILRILGDRK